MRRERLGICWGLEDVLAFYRAREQSWNCTMVLGCNLHSQRDANSMLESHKLQVCRSFGMGRFNLHLQLPPSQTLQPSSMKGDVSDVAACMVHTLSTQHRMNEVGGDSVKDVKPAGGDGPCMMPLGPSGAMEEEEGQEQSQRPGS